MGDMGDIGIGISVSYRFFKVISAALVSVMYRLIGIGIGDIGIGISV